MGWETEVANMACVRMGTGRITSLDDGKPQASALKAAWDLQRRATIRDGSWNFALQYRSLPALNVMAPSRFDAVFQLPADCLRLIEVIGPGGQPSAAYELAGGKIYACLSAPLDIRYLADVPTLGNWDPQALEAFACRLAWKCGRRVAGSAYAEAAGEEEYLRAIAAAKRTDALENPPIEQAESSWIEARGGYSSARRAGWEIS